MKSMGFRDIKYYIPVYHECNEGHKGHEGNAGHEGHEGHEGHGTWHMSCPPIQLDPPFFLQDIGTWKVTGFWAPPLGGGSSASLLDFGSHNM